MVNFRAETEGQVTDTPFAKMVVAYRETIGSAYPKQDVLAVLAVFEQCAVAFGTSQDLICLATGLKASNVNKIIRRGCDKGWIYREEGRTTGGTKELLLTEKGLAIFVEFDRRCKDAIAPKRTGRGRAKEAKHYNLFTERPEESS